MPRRSAAITGAGAALVVALAASGGAAQTTTRALASASLPAPPGSGSAGSSAPAAAPAPPAAGTAAPPAGPSPLNPTPAEFPGTSPAANTPGLDALLARVAALRSRIAALASAMFSSRLRIEVRADGSEAARLEALHVSLDGGLVYSAPARAVFERPEVIYEHAVAPGRHVVSIEVERHDARNPAFSTWQESRFVILVPEKKLLRTRFELEDESSMGEDFEEEDAGQYQLRVQLLAEVDD